MKRLRYNQEKQQFVIITLTTHLFDDLGNPAIGISESVQSISFMSLRKTMMWNDFMGETAVKDLHPAQLEAGLLVTQQFLDAGAPIDTHIDQGLTLLVWNELFKYETLFRQGKEIKANLQEDLEEICTTMRELDQALEETFS